jgi:alkaline phosphatase D
LNNWYPTEIVGPPTFPNNTHDSVLAGFSLTAFHEHNPIPADRPIYRSQQYGANLEVFFLDQRSYRGANDANEDPAGNNVELGANQLAWLKQALLNSVATWKIISNDDPISIVTGK